MEPNTYSRPSLHLSRVSILSSRAMSHAASTSGRSACAGRVRADGVRRNTSKSAARDGNATAAPTRRAALISLLSSRVLVETPPSARAKTTFVKDPSFYAEWSYAQPSDIIPYVEATAPRGDARAVLAAMDVFGEYYPMYKLGDEKGRILATIVRDRSPSKAVEVGTFLGYSAIWTALNLPPGGTLTCVEFEPRHVAVARALTTYAGVGDVVTILQGAGAERVSDVKKIIGQDDVADMVFFDHCKECYLPDLRSFEDAGIVGKGTVVVADNVLYPGAPDFLSYVDTAAGRYDTKLYDAAFEYDQVWKKDWTPQADALSYSVCRGPVEDAEVVL